MPIVSFPYPEVEPLHIPDANFAGLFERARVEAPEDTDAFVKASLEAPHGPSLAHLAGAGSRVLILVDDVSRPTRADLVLPPLLGSLHGAGVIDPDIQFLMALGTHRAMTESEIEAKVGADVYRRYKTRNHEWLNPAALVAMATTESGVEIHVNRMLKEADLIIGVGHIAPHGTAGFGGGTKIVLPGVSGQSTILAMHALARAIGHDKLRGTIENPVREVIDEVGLKAGLRFVVNVVQDGERNIMGCHSGDPIAVHRAGARQSLAVHGTPVPGQFDIIVIDSHPADLDLWQAGKALGAAASVTRENGAIIFLTPCPDGVSPEHPIWLQLAHLDDATVQMMIDTGAIDDKVGASAVIGMRWYSDRFSIYLVSPGISQADTEHLGLRYAASPQEALDAALAQYGRSASVGVFRNGGEMLPVLPHVVASA